MLSRRWLLTGSMAVAGVGYLAFPPTQAASAGTIAAEDWAAKLVGAASQQVGITLVYDPSYTQLAYPGGDVPRVKGVCTDVIIRAYRDALDIDLQKRVHDDMKRAFSAYPRKWGLKVPDSNIDHRRVPNLQTFLTRAKADMPVSQEGMDYQPGDIVTQNLPGNKTHIVLVSNLLNGDGTRPLAIHNIGRGAQIEDVLLAFEVTGHYRYRG